MANGDIQPVKLGARDWLWIISAIVGVLVSLGSAMLGVSLHLQDDMRDLDIRWQSRAMEMTRDIRADIQAVEQSHPPEWLVERVNNLEMRVRDLEKHK